MTYYIGPTISDWQKQIILGTVLGGSSIVKPTGGRNSYLSMRGKDAYWLEYKSQELKTLASPSPFLIEKDNRYFRWHSLCYPEFNIFHKMFYENKQKKVDMDILNRLRDIGLMVWFIDGGKLNKKKITLNTNTFGEDGTNLINIYFNEIGITNKSYNKNKSFRINLDEEGTVKFLKVIGHRIPNFMLSKISLEN